MVKRLIGSILLLLGLLSPSSILAGNIVVRVVDETGSPLAGAHISLTGNKGPIITDSDGKFNLSLPSGSSAKLHISYIGFVTETFVLRGTDGNSTQTIRLTPDTASLEEVVVTATRTPKSLKDVPVVTRLISADDIRKADATNIQDLLTEESVSYTPL
ncbi:MAG: TonB-dependent receptor, partial [Duncaniella sp.]|nr:TonB-dependent receptor [Duncaniella sp.]